MKHQLSLLFLVLLGYTSVQAQSSFPKGMGFIGGFHTGQILKHTVRITLPLDGISFGGELGVEWKMFGKHDWDERCQYPRLGVSLSYQNFANPQQLGHGIGIIPHVTVDFIKKKRWRLFGRLGLGLAIVTRPYNIVTNTANNIIGSNLNNNTALRLGFAYRVSDKVELRPSFSFTHYSNGASQYPNLGINVISFHMAAVFTPNPIMPSDIITGKDTLPKRVKRIQTGMMLGLGYKESSTIGGPKYPIFLLSADVGMFVARNNRLRIGLEYEWNGDYFAFQYHSGTPDRAEASRTATLLSAYVEDEVLLGRIGLVGRVGFYLTDSDRQPWFLYTRVSMRYYFRNPLTGRGVNPYIGWSLKAHRIVAEYFSIVAGSTF